MPNSKNQSTDQNRNGDKDNKNLKTAADFEQTARKAEEEKGTLKPGQSANNPTKQHNNGRGGGK
jgi:hypothetical protein